MAKGIYVGINGTSRKVKKIYAGINGGVRNIKHVYANIGGVVRRVWSSTIPAGAVSFGFSQNWTVPEGVYFIDVFIVGGGGGVGGSYSYFTSSSTSETYSSLILGGGDGGCGYTATYKNVAVTPGQVIPVTIGAGGARGMEYYLLVSNGYNNWGGDTQSPSGQTDGQGGQASYFGSLSAAGGKGGKRCVYGSSLNGQGGVGGSGGGAGERFKFQRYSNGQETTLYDNPRGLMGYDGGNGGNSTNGTTGGSGQGRSTRAFEEPGGELYASRDSASYRGMGGTKNGMYTSDGSEGLVLVRWAEQ
jgi:hypothetical protein